MVSPWKTGLGNSTFSKPRLPTVVPSVVSPTEIPTAMPSVSRLFTSGLPNSALAAAWKSMCSGCGFIVSVEKKTLSASVMVRPTSWRKVWPTCSSSKCLPAIDALLSRDDPIARMVHHPRARQARVARRTHRVRRSSLRGGEQRELDGEDGAPVETVALGMHRPPVRLHEVVHDGEPKAEPALPLRRGALPKSIEEVREQLGLDAAAVV